MPEEQTEPLAREGETIAAELESEYFHCPQCGVLAQQEWSQLLRGNYYIDYLGCTCRNCRRQSIWQSTGNCAMIDPTVGGGPRPHIDMPEDVKVDYEEAREIVRVSPRGSCALLRLAVQKLCVDLGEPGKDINTDIGSLVKKGLSTDVQEAMDTLRVVGNEAVHPGELDLKDDVETATGLFDLLNFVVDDMIARPKRHKALFAKIPKNKAEGIKQRDKR